MSITEHQHFIAKCVCLVLYLYKSQRCPKTRPSTRNNVSLETDGRLVEFALVSVLNGLVFGAAGFQVSGIWGWVITIKN